MSFLSHTSGVGYKAGLAAATVLHAVISLPQLLLCLPLLCSGVTPRTEVPEQAQFEPGKTQPPANQTKPQQESRRHLPENKPSHWTEWLIGMVYLVFRDRQAVRPNGATNDSAKQANYEAPVATPCTRTSTLSSTNNKRKSIRNERQTEFGKR